MSSEMPEVGVPDTPIDAAQRWADEFIAAATADAERIRSSARAEAEQIRAEARQQARALLSEVGAQLAEMGDAYREAIREARNVVRLVADNIYHADHTRLEG